ncbi:MAG: DEAD/DEAH box helicase family protein [Lachnospiraceae bacterium]|nr:DEAD/DEAH box helicase family protein [Lachnospiraceae bacterium]
MYISDIIKDEYIGWGQRLDTKSFLNNIVFITAPTGTGKTTFVLNTLLPFAYQNNRRIYYLVNREVLKRQIQEKIDIITAEYASKGLTGMNQCICVNTYQSLEKNIKTEGKNQLYKESFDYIICDEAHYFLNDALFNTNTLLSYFSIAEFFGIVPVVFMSATMENIYPVICNAEKFRKRALGEISPITLSNELLFTQKTVMYTGEGDYSYLNIYSFGEISEIPDIIRKENQRAKEKGEKQSKWLIFYNDIKKGKDLAKELKKQKHDAVFVDSNHEDEKEAEEVVNNIARDSIITADVVIATSVLDNGVSIEDRELRNLIILAENKIEFIQMLGRKRQDGQRVNLYLCRRRKVDFVNRLHYVDKLWKACLQSHVLLDKGDTLAYVERLLESPSFYRYARCFLFQPRSAAYNYEVVEKNEKHLNSEKETENEKETDKEEPSEIRRIYSARWYQLFINYFSEVAIANQVDFYNLIIKKFEKEGEYAFMNEQCRWLGIPPERIKELRAESIENETEEVKRKLVRILDEIKNDELSATRNKEIKKESISKLVIDLLRKLLDDEEIEENIVELKALKEDIRKHERPMTYPKFNRCMELFDLPYRMDEKEGEPYIIREIGDVVDNEEI